MYACALCLGPRSSILKQWNKCEYDADDTLIKHKPRGCSAIFCFHGHTDHLTHIVSLLEASALPMVKSTHTYMSLWVSCLYWLIIDYLFIVGFYFLVFWSIIYLKKHIKFSSSSGQLDGASCAHGCQSHKCSLAYFCIHGFGLAQPRLCDGTGLWARD